MVAPRLGTRWAPWPLVPFVLLLLTGVQCGPRLSIDAPDPLALFDESPVAVSGQIAKAFAPGSVQLRLDGVDLISALALVPPFLDAGGVVDIGGNLISVSGFDFDPTAPGVTPIVLDLDALPAGDHVLELEAQRSGQAPLVVTRSFGVALAFVLPAAVLDAGGLTSPLDLGPEGTLIGASLGQPLVSAPIALDGGSELRPGFVPVREELITGEPQ